MKIEELCTVSKAACSDIKRRRDKKNRRQKRKTSITLWQHRPPDSQTELRATEVTETIRSLQARRTEAQWGIV